MAASPFAAAAALGPIGSFEPFTHDENRQALTDLFTTRSLQHSEAQLLQRCTAAVEQCRRDLQDLRAACKAANSHREKCAELLGAATEAVVALEDMLYDPNIDMQLERSLQQLSSRVQTALDKGEAVVRVYGSMNGIMKLASRMCSPGTGYKFDDAIKDLTTLAKQARMQRQPGPRFSTGPSSATGGMDGRSSAPATTAAVTPNAMTPAVSNSNQSTVLPFGSAPISSPTGRGSGPSSTAPSGLPPLDEVSVQLPPLPLAQGSGQAFMVGDRQVPEEAMHWQKVRKGGSRQAITAMVHVPPREVGHLGRLWYYLSKSVFSSGSLFIVDLSSGVDVEVKEARSDKTFTCMHLDDASNFIWTGHSNGHIRVWDAEKQEALLDGVKVFGHPVSTITTDELGRCWVGGDKGRIKSYKLEWSEQSGVALGWKLVLRGELNVVSDGIPEPDWEPVVGDGMTWHPLAKESAHYGPVRTIAAAAGRVWTCGGSSAFAVLKEWTPDGILVDTHSMRSMGLINHMVVVSPIAIVQESQRQRNTGSQSQALSSFTTTTSLAIASRAPATVLVEVDMPWQLLTAHDNGVVQVWGYIDVNRALVPLVRIGDRVAPALRIVVCEPLGSIITTHNDGKVRVRPIHHPRSARGLKIVYQEGSVSTIREVNMPSVQLDTSRSGLSSALGGRIGVVTASNSATIKLWPVAELRRLAEDGSVDVQGAMAEPAQWPVFQFTPFGLKQYLEEQLLAQQQMSMEYDTSIDDDARRSSRGAMEAFEQVVFGEENNRWQIDWKDLTRTRIIGEGAFGKVWLGRWQETDVAIKQLGSLSALGVETGSIQHDSTGGLKLNKEVQRALEKEVGLLKEMRHPNIILFMGVVLDPAAVVTEYCARGSLYDLLQEAREKPALKRALDWPRRVVMALDAAKGMLYLHGHKPAIIHRDLKSPNLLVEKNWKVKVTDFNLSKATQASQNNVMSSIQAINPRWQPPEVILRQEYTKASDVYAFGLILWELLTWELPFQNMSVLQIMLNITQQNARPPVPDQYGASALPGGTFSGYDEYVGLMRRCWAEDPEARPTFEKVIADLRKVANILSEARDAATLRPSLGTAHSRNMSRQSMAAILAAGPAAGAPARVPSPPPAAAIAVPAAAAADNSIDVLAAMTAQLDSAYREGQSQGQPSVRSDGGSERGNISTQVSQVSYAATSWGGTSPSLAGAASGASVISTPVPVMSPFDASGPFGSGGTSSGGTGAFGGSVGGAPPAAALQAAALLASGGAVPTDGVSASAGSPQTSWYGGVGAGPFSASAGSPQASWYGAGAAPVPGQTVSSAGPPPPSPFGGGADVSIGLVVSSAGAPPPSPFGDGVQGLRGQTVSSAGPPPPSPFGGDASLPGQTVSSAGPPPPSPFGGDASLPGQTVSSAGPPPPSPFGGNPSLPGQTVSSAGPPPPSPFGGDASLPGQTVSSAGPPPPSPFGGDPSLPGQTVSSAGPPPPSPFGGGTAAPAGQPISSAAPAPPSPFGDVASVGGGQAVSSAAAPPPSPFGDAPAAGGGQAISSAAPPPPSPFGDGGFSVPPMLAAAQPPSAASSDAGAGAGAPRLGRLSPYAARSPRSGSPANRAQLDAASLPPTVLEATPSMERTAAAAGGSPLAPGVAAPQDSKSSGRSSSNNRNSQLVDSALTADAGRVPRSSGSSGGTAATGDEAAAGGGAEAQDGDGLQSRPSAKPGVLQRLLSGGGRRARLP